MRVLFNHSDASKKSANFVNNATLALFSSKSMMYIKNDT